MREAENTGCEEEEADLNETTMGGDANSMRTRQRNGMYVPFLEIQSGSTQGEAPK